MIENEALNLLNILYDFCSDEVLKIIDYSDIRAIKDYSNEEILEYSDFLKDKEYISLKYADDTEICLKITSRGKRYVEDIRYQEKLARQAEQERLEKERRDKEEAEHRARLEEERKQAALEIQQMIEETREKMKKMSRHEKEEAAKKVEELENSEVLKEVEEEANEVTAVENISNSAVQQQSAALVPQQTAVDVNYIIAELRKTVKKTGALWGFIGAILGSIVSCIITLIIS